MNLSDNVSMDATLTVMVVPTDSRIPPFKHFEGKNKITNKARAHLLHLAVDNPQVYEANPITRFKVGSGGVAVVPTGAETDLYTEIVASGNYDDSLTRSYSSGDMMSTFSFQLGPDDCNGLDISELGMFADDNWMNNAANGKMFNIRTFPEVTKLASFSLSFVWRVNFSGVYSA